MSTGYDSHTAFSPLKPRLPSRVHHLHSSGDASKASNFDWAAITSPQLWNCTQGPVFADWTHLASTASTAACSPIFGADPFLIDNTWITADRIGSGSFGDVYDAVHTVTGEKAAVKVERSARVHTVSIERQVYLSVHRLSACEGIPRMLYYGEWKKSAHLLVMDRLGSSLHALKNKSTCNRLRLEQVLAYGIQALQCLRSLHDAGWVHCDVKPDNFLVGYDNPETLYLVDFGLSRRYADENGFHLPENDYEGFIGSLAFASVTAHRGILPSRRCDLESLGYTLVLLFQGTLPWIQDNHGTTVAERRMNARGQKLAVNIETLCHGMGWGLEEYFKYVTNLCYSDCPDYGYLRSLLCQSMDM